ncbi:MAG: sulfatase-like hydrolase/transferase, partial [Planctomycetales bacterium]|nr:sulfatase-like hydrolase/transferase [Planctomycetales bacterium]
EALTREAKAAVRAAVENEQPFFLYMAHYAVHAPFQADPRFSEHYRDSGKTDPAQAFATLIEGMDKSLGDLLAQLDELQIAENTLVLFLGDNGSDAPLGHEHQVASAAPLRGRKGAHYEGGMRVPFIAAWARGHADNACQQRLPIAAGAIQPQLAAVYDLFPTVLAACDIRLPAGLPCDGQRLDRLLRGQSDPEHAQTFLMHYPHAPHRSDYFTVYRQGEWKVIYHYYPSPASEGSHYQLFNLERDPFESNNLAAREPQRLRDLMDGLREQLQAQGAQYPLAANGGPLEPQLPPPQL